MPSSKEKTVNVPYLLFTLILCVVVIGMLCFETTSELNDEVKQLLRWVDYVLCFLFFIDFIYQLITLENRKKYMLTWGWIDLISCIPTFGWGRIARLLRILKLLKAIRSGKTLIDAISRRRGESALFSAAIMIIFAVLFGSVAILQCEMDEPDGNIHNASDAVWWTFCTVMKGGAENYDPVSIEGRLVATVLMFVGAAFSATIIGFMAMLLTSNRNQNNPDDSPTGITGE
jgi:voltage-gated potassium channel